MSPIILLLILHTVYGSHIHEKTSIYTTEDVHVKYTNSNSGYTVSDSLNVTDKPMEFQIANAAVDGSQCPSGQVKLNGICVDID